MALAVILRIFTLLWLGPVDPSGGDFALYDRMARNLVVEGDFGGEPLKTLGSPNINPGLALWLAFLYAIFGDSPLVPMAGQVVLGALLVYGAYLFASLVFNKKAGLLAGFIIALFPPVIIITVEPYSVLLYSVLFLFSLFFFLKGLYTRKLYHGVIAGLLLGAATLNESIAFYLPVIIGLWFLVLVIRKTVDYKQAGLLFSLFILGFVAVLTPWAVRNIKVAESEVRIVSKGELQLISPATVSKVSNTLSQDNILFSGIKRMFLLPYGIWLLDQGPVDKTISYKTLPGKILKGETFPLNVLAILVIKISAVAFYWGLLLAGILAAFKFRALGSLLALLLLYTATAGIGYVAFQGGDFSTVSYLSIFIVPLTPIFAAFAGGLFINQAESKPIRK